MNGITRCLFQVNRARFQGNIDRIPAIVAILCAASDVFNAMFVGEFERPTDVPVPDAEPEAFKVMLR